MIPTILPEELDALNLTQNIVCCLMPFPEEISEGKRHITPFKPIDLEAGRFFILQGMLTYLERDASIDQAFDFNSGNKIRRDGRTHCIFNNGTESDLLYRSLTKALEKEGFSVSDSVYGTDTDSTILPEDNQKGFIYVLKSRSADPTNPCNSKLIQDWIQQWGSYRSYSQCC